MPSSIVSVIQECYCVCVSFGITPNLVQEISSVVSSFLIVGPRVKCTFSCLPRTLDRERARTIQERKREEQSGRSLNLSLSTR